MPTLLPQAKREILFRDPKLNAAREAAVAGDWSRMFQILPRGCVGPDGVTDAQGRKGVCGDLPNVKPGSPQGAAAYRYWRGGNPLSKNLTVNDLRYVKDANGNIVYKPVTADEARRLAEGYHWARHDWTCTPGQVAEYAARWGSGSDIYVTAQCAESSASRRRDLAKKVAIGAAAVTGAVFLGPQALSAAKVAGSKALAAGGKVIGDATGVINKAFENSGQLIDAVNAKRTIDAMKDGKVPPPPIDIDGGNFTDYALAFAQDEYARQAGEKAARQQEAAMRAEIQRMQNLMLIQRAQQAQPPSYYTSSAIAPEVKKQMLKSKQQSETINNAALIALPVMAALVLTQ